MITRNERIQIVRAICIFSVVLIHAVYLHPYEIYIRPFINFSVGGFLFLSGLLTVQGKYSWKELYQKRLTRIIVPYVIWSVICFSFYTARGTIQEEALGKEFLYRLVTGQCCPIYYYVLVYIQMVILTPWLLKFCKSKLWWIGILVTPVTLLLYYSYIWKGGTILYPWNTNNFLVWLVFYYLGLVLTNGFPQKEISNKIGYCVLPAIGLELIEAKYWLLNDHYDIATSQIKMTSMFTTIIVLFIFYNYINNDSEKNSVWKKLAVSMGGCSFGMYLMHEIPNDLLSSYLQGYPFWRFPVNGIVITILSFVIIRIGQVIIGKKIGKWLGLY